MIGRCLHKSKNFYGVVAHTVSNLLYGKVINAQGSRLGPIPNLIKMCGNFKSFPNKIYLIRNFRLFIPMVLKVSSGITKMHNAAQPVISLPPRGDKVISGYTILETCRALFIKLNAFSHTHRLGLTEFEK